MLISAYRSSLVYFITFSSMEVISRVLFFSSYFSWRSLGVPLVISAIFLAMLSDVTDFVLRGGGTIFI